jgi:hypothetical protein
METENSQTLHQSHQQYWNSHQQLKYPNMKEYCEDQLLGKAKELSTFDIIKKVMGTHMRCSSDKYACLDYFSTIYKVKGECKARRNTHKKYSTTMVGENKIIEAERLKKKGYEVIFFFNFTDGLYYFKYSNFDNIRSHKKIGGTYRRGLREMKMYRYINVYDLIKVDVNCPIDYIKTKRKKKSKIGELMEKKNVKV